jgi:hypothetical protein
MKNKPTILFTTPVLQHPAAGGPYLRIENSIKALSKISNLYVYSRVSLDKIGGDIGLSFYKNYCKGFYFAPFTISGNKYTRFFKRAISFLSRKIINKDIFTLNEESEQNFQHLLEIADIIRVDVIWLGFGNLSYSLLKYIKSKSKYKVVLDTDSVWSRFILRELPFAVKRGRKNKKKKDGVHN